MDWRAVSRASSAPNVASSTCVCVCACVTHTDTDRHRQTYTHTQDHPPDTFTNTDAHAHAHAVKVVSSTRCPEAMSVGGKFRMLPWAPQVYEWMVPPACAARRMRCSQLCVASWVRVFVANVWLMIHTEACMYVCIDDRHKYRHVQGSTESCRASR